jgi:hypothetical protein
MIPLFVGLTAFNLLCLIVVGALGYGVAMHYDLSVYHQLCGVLATMTCCAVHCVVFTYFIATAKWVQHAIEVKQLDPQLASPTRSFKAQALPVALAAIGSVFIAAVFGAIKIGYGISPLYHHVMAVIAVLTNGIAAVVEFRAIKSNGALIDRILELAAVNDG